MTKYLLPVSLMLASNEILSWIALCIVGCMFIWDIAEERGRYRNR